MAGADLRDAIIEGIDFTSVNLKGVYLDAIQGVYIARSYGAIIE
jgi:uncharacterized protein YjbI with pentapeptide repeats